MVNQKDVLINERIPFKEIFLIAENGEKIGLVSKKEALNKARKMNLNLICLSPHVLPPVCKMISEQQAFNLLKRKKKTVKQVTQEIKINYHIGKNDLVTKINYIKRLLIKGNTVVKVNLQMQGREKEHKKLAEEKCQKIITDLYENSGGKINLMGEIKSQDRSCYFRLFLKNK